MPVTSPSAPRPEAPGDRYALALRADDFFTGDTTYFELARSLLAHGMYGFNARPETVVPPGFPAFMATRCVTVGCGYSVFIHAMVVGSTLGVLAGYELLRRVEGRVAAGVISLLVERLDQARSRPDTGGDR